jgi:hypothetical protein
MGKLSIHDLSVFGCDIFIETGTESGEGLSYAQNFKFSELYSIEIDDQRYRECIPKFASAKNVSLINNNSTDALNEILHKIPETQKILFWLDAHFPGNWNETEWTKDKTPVDVIMPLKSEIETIFKHRHKCKDSFIIDDLRLFEDLEFEFKLNNEGIDAIAAKYKISNKFIYELYENSHNITKDLRQHGYLILTPKVSVL